MRPRCLLLAAAFLAAAVPVARTEDKPTLPEGNWILSGIVAFGDSPSCLIKSEVKDGQLTLSVLASPPSIETKISEVKTDKGLSFKLNTVQTVKDQKTGQERKFPGERVFIAAPGSTGKVILGSLGTDVFNSRAKLTATDSEKLGTLARSPAFETMSTVQGLNQKAAIAQNKARAEKDKEKKKELQADAAKLRKDADAQIPDLLRTVVKEHAESSSALDAASTLLSDYDNAKVKADEATALTKLILKQSAMYGPRFANNNDQRLAGLLVRSKGLEPVAILAIEPIAKSLKDSDPLGNQFDCLSIYQSALEAVGRKDEVKAVETRLAKLDVALDKEYVETVPPFKPKAFAGRENASRVAVMELFTGAQCPPCVAADVAFDALGKSYQPKDVILIQYHMHIPGPDPLTNPATVARWDYYSELFPYNPMTGSGVGGTPTTLFNGKIMAGGGGGMANAEAKFKEYSKVLSPFLEKTSEIVLSGTGTRDGDAISLSVEVKGAAAKDGVKLRLLLVEDTIKYVGGNKLRFHHQVVRAMPGGPDGAAIKDGSFKHTATANVAAIRKELSSYLDEYAAKERPFPYPKIRPLDMKNLKAIALVQNDATGEILQAVQFEITGK